MKHKLLTLVISTIAAIGTLYAQTTGTCGINVSYRIANDTLRIYQTDPSLIGIGEMTMHPWSGTFHHVVIEYGVTNICNDAFYRRYGIQSVSIPNSVTSIGVDAFLACDGLTSVTIPNSVSSIGNGAFSYCHNMENVVINNGVINNNAFSYCVKLSSATLNNGVTSIGNYAFERCDNLVSIAIPNSVTSIGAYAFTNCGALTTVTFGNGLITIGNFAFSQCSSLNAISIPSRVTNIGKYTFKECPALKSLVVESGNNKYDSRNNCNAIIETNTYTLLYGCKNTIIPDGIKKIQACAFYNQSELTSVTIPNTVTNIGDSAFLDCDYLTSVTFKRTTPPTFASTRCFNTICMFFVPCGSKNTYVTALNRNVVSNINVDAIRVVEKPTYSYSLRSNNPDYGYISVIQQPTCTQSTLIIRANHSNAHSRFVAWEDGNTDNPRSIFLDGDTNMVAIFETDIDNIEHLYEIGDNQSWQPQQAIELTKIAENIFEGEFVFSSDTSYFAFITVKPDTANWTLVNENRFGGENNNLVFGGSVAELHMTTYDNPQRCFTITPGTYILRVNLSDMNLSVRVKDTSFYPARGENGEYTLVNKWLISNTLGNFTQNRPAGVNMCRGMAVYNGNMYFIDREHECFNIVDGETGIKRNSLPIIGNHLFQTWNPGRNEWSSCVTLPFNDVKFDNAGHCLITACAYGSQRIMVYTVDMGTGIATELINECLHDYPNFTHDSIRMDAIGVYGDVTNDAVVMFGNSLNKELHAAYKWEIRNGIVGTAQRINLIVNPQDNTYLWENGQLTVENNSACQVFPVDFNRFYWDHHSCRPTVFDMNGSFVDDLKACPTGTAVRNNAGDTCRVESHYNGLCEFQIGNDYFVIMSASHNEDSRNPSTLAIFKFADASKAFAGATPLWYLPIGGMGSQQNAYRTAVPSVKVNGNKASIYFYVGENGYGVYEMTCNNHCVISSGICGALGDHITWDLSCDSVLTISGTGEMMDWSDDSSVPWVSYRSSIKSVVINDGITNIGTYAFYACDRLSTVTLPSSIESIGEFAFFHCNGLKGCLIPDNINYIGDGAFSSCNSLSSIEFINPTPPTIQSTRTFYNTTCHFVVPCDSRNSYVTELNNSVYSDYVIDSARVVGKLAFSYTVNSSNAWGSFNIIQEPTCTNPELIVQANEITGYYHFVRWEDGIINNPRTFTITQDTILTAIFEIEQYIVSLSARNGTTVGAGTYDYGSQVILNVYANDHYHFAHWSDGNTDNPRILTVEKDTNLVAICEIDQYTVTASGANGSVMGGGIYDYNSQVTLEATPNAHYHFISWGDGDTSNPRTITVNRDTSIMAVFEIDYYNVSAIAENGTVVCTSRTDMASYTSTIGGGTYAYNTELRLTVNPNRHYHFTRWEDDREETGSTHPISRTFIVEQDTTLVAICEIDQHTIVVTAENATVTGSGKYNYGSQITLSATPDDHYHFVRWSDGNTDNPRILLVSNDCGLSAICEIDQHTISVSAINGQVVGAGTYSYNSLVALSAIPDDGYQFDHWSEGTDCAECNPNVIVLLNDMTMEAFFVPIQNGIEEFKRESFNTYIVGKTLYVNNNDQSFVVISASGALVYQGAESIVRLPDSGMYIVLSGGQAVKVTAN